MPGSLIHHGCWPSFATLHCGVQFDWYSDWDFHAIALTSRRGRFAGGIRISRAVESLRDPPEPMRKLSWPRAVANCVDLPLP
jgi:hypothetical protein